ncbi:MAG: hypothetical protein ALECFALPRED_009394 [Alectoria fallacina]|uniref:5-formyltetrahydrofolate cyclo-ligase n=1 Tax=Alectoria fallacina TaxID=1903189 RepID=A0A8H3I8Y4_9LECA|nr:MAG: hypothetical protein ALECFALPRED_009394 [Alectoria fallacina]
MAGLRAAKKELRALMRQRLSQLSPESLKQQSAAATETLLSLPEYKNAQYIGVYLSMPKGEVVTRAIIHDALGQGKQVFVPYIYSTTVQDHLKSRSTMDMISLRSKSDYEGLEPDAWGIPSVAENSIAERGRILEDLGEYSGAVSQDVTTSERNSKSWSTDSRRLDLIVMPGVAFDRSLGRLGHGKGFYDYFLKRYHEKVSPLPEETRMPFLGVCQGF